MVEDHKQQYIIETRCGKLKLALEIIDSICYQKDLPGGFLKFDDDDGALRDVGDKKASENMSQAL